VTLRETFGTNVRHYRQARNLKQHEIAEAVDRSRRLCKQNRTRRERAAVYQRREFLAERKDALDRWGAHVAEICDMRHAGRFLSRAPFVSSVRRLRNGVTSRSNHH
jgi:transcriptional regulator with XRE-family HTH domain